MIRSSLQPFMKVTLYAVLTPELLVKDQASFKQYISGRKNGFGLGFGSSLKALGVFWRRPNQPLAFGLFLSYFGD